MKKIFFYLATCLLSLNAFADVSVHVLDMNKGLPGKLINVSFYEKVDSKWYLLSRQTTDKDGRIKRFRFNPKTKSTDFKAVFHVTPYFKKQGVKSFYKDIPVDFEVKDRSQHYHIPLLLSPFGYSTYRGS